MSVLVLTGCQHLSSRRGHAQEAEPFTPLTAGQGLLRSASSERIEADLDPVQALTEGVRAVLLALPEQARGRVLARWRPRTPRSALIMLPLPLTRGSVTLSPRPVKPLEPLELLPVLRELFKRQGSTDLTLAAFFLGPEAVGRARARLKLPVERIDLEKLAAQVPRSAAGALRYAREARTRALLFGLAWPVERSWRVTSGFGSRIHPIVGGRSEHRGVDVGVPEGTAVHAPADGVVASVQEGPVNGRMLELRHDGGVRTFYCHLSQVEVKPGQKVRVGEPVGASGATGRVTGPHLHYQVQFAGDWVDPVRIRASARLVSEPFPWESEALAAPGPAAMR